VRCDCVAVCGGGGSCPSTSSTRHLQTQRLPRRSCTFTSKNVAPQSRPGSNAGLLAARCVGRVAMARARQAWRLLLCEGLIM
jgi:hypothetical protein